MGWLKYCGGLFTDHETEAWRRGHPRLFLLGTMIIVMTPLAAVAVMFLAICGLAHWYGG